MVQRLFLFLTALLAFSVTKSNAEAYVVWCEGNATLYFLSSDESIEEGSTYEGQTVTTVWSGEDVTDRKLYSDPSPDDDYTYPVWYKVGRDAMGAIKHVVFKESFKDIKCKRTAGWFSQFVNLVSIDGLEYLDTSEVTSMHQMFLNCPKLESIDVSHFDTSKVRIMTAMFANCRLRSLDLSNFDTSNVENMWGMFSDSGILELTLGSNFNTSKITRDDGYQLEGNIGKIIFTGDIPENLDKDIFTGYGEETAPQPIHVPNEYKANYEARLIGGKFLGGYVAFNPKHPYAMFDEDSKTLTLYYGEITGDLDIFHVGWGVEPEEIEKVVFDESFAEARVTSTQYWFGNSDYSNLVEFVGLEYLNTSEVTDMSGMFGGCSKITRIDISQFNTSKVTNMTDMFAGCESLEEVVFGSGLDTRLLQSDDEADLGLYNFERLTTVSFIGDVPANLDKNIFQGVGLYNIPPYLNVSDTYRSNYESKISEGQFFGGYFTFTKEEANFPVTIPVKAGLTWATYYQDVADYRVSDDVEVYELFGVRTATGEVGLIKIDLIPKGVPVILHSTSDGGFKQSDTMTKTLYGDDYSTSDDWFKGVTEDTNIAGDGTIYILMGSQFVKADVQAGANMMLPANRCYLSIPPEYAASRLTLVIIGDETAIKAINTIDDHKEGKWYNLQGLSISQPTKKGLYIRNGKKMIVR